MWLKQSEQFLGEYKLRGPMENRSCMVLDVTCHFSIIFSIDHSIIGKYVTPHTSTPLFSGLRILKGKRSFKSVVASFLLCHRDLDSLKFTHVFLVASTVSCSFSEAF